MADGDLFTLFSEEDEAKRQEAERRLGEIMGAGSGQPATEDLFVDPSSAGPSVAALLEEFKRISLQRNADPAAVVEEKLKGISVGKRMLADFFLGASAISSGKPMENTRDILFKREILKREFNDKKYTALQNMLDSFVKADSETRQAASANLGTQEEAASSLLDSVNIGRKELIRGAVQQEIDDYNSSLAQELEQTKFRNAQKLSLSKLPNNFQEAIVQNTLALFNAETPEEQAKLKAQNETLFDLSKRFLQQDATNKSGGTPVQLNEIEIKTAYGTAKGIKNPLTGEVTIPTHTIHVGGNVYSAPSVELSKEWAEAARLASDRAELLSNMNELYRNVDNAGALQLKNTLTNFSGQLQALATIGFGEDATEKLDTFNKNIEAILPTLSGAQAEFLLKYQTLVGQTVKAFTGAQATDSERKFILTTLPQMLGNSTTFALGMGMMELSANWMAYKIRKHLIDKSGNPLNAGEWFGRQMITMENDINEFIKRGVRPSDRALENIGAFRNRTRAENDKTWGSMSEEEKRRILAIISFDNLSPEIIEAALM